MGTAPIQAEEVWLSTYETAERLMGYEPGEGRIAYCKPDSNRTSYKPRYGINKWRERLRHAMQAREIEFRKDPGKAKNSPAQFEWRSVLAWRNKRWPVTRVWQNA